MAEEKKYRIWVNNSKTNDRVTDENIWVGNTPEDGNSKCTSGKTLGAEYSYVEFTWDELIRAVGGGAVIPVTLQGTLEQTSDGGVENGYKLRIDLLMDPVDGSQRIPDDIGYYFDNGGIAEILPVLEKWENGVHVEEEDLELTRPEYENKINFIVRTGNSFISTDFTEVNDYNKKWIFCASNYSDYLTYNIIFCEYAGDEGTYVAERTVGICGRTDISNLEISVHGNYGIKRKITPGVPITYLATPNINNSIYVYATCVFSTDNPNNEWHMELKRGYDAGDPQAPDWFRFSRQEGSTSGGGGIRGNQSVVNRRCPAYISMINYSDYKKICTVKLSAFDNGQWVKPEKVYLEQLNVPKSEVNFWLEIEANSTEIEYTGTCNLSAYYCEQLNGDSNISKMPVTEFTTCEWTTDNSYVTVNDGVVTGNNTTTRTKKTIVTASFDSSDYGDVGLLTASTEITVGGKPQEGYIKYNGEEVTAITVSQFGHQETFTVSANTDWAFHVPDYASWMQCVGPNPQAIRGTAGEYEVKIIVDENVSFESRMEEVRLILDEDIYFDQTPPAFWTVQVTQDGL